MNAVECASRIPKMAQGKPIPFATIRTGVLGLVAAIPEGRFTTYGTLARRLGVNPRHVASVLARLEAEESASLPWHRVVAAEGRLSQGMAEDLRGEQRKRLEQEGFAIDARGFIVDPDARFHAPGHGPRWLDA